MRANIQHQTRINSSFNRKIIPPTGPGGSRRSAPRVPIDALVRIQVADQEELVDVLAANISLTGMFVRTQEPHPAGSVLRFELRLGDDSASAQGVGEVAWVRRGELFSVLPAGMGIRFRRFDQDGRDVISRVIDPRPRTRALPARLSPHRR